MFGQSSVKVSLPIQKNFKMSPVAESSPSHSQVLHETQIFDLVRYDFIIKDCCKEMRTEMKDLKTVNGWKNYMYM